MERFTQYVADVDRVDLRDRQKFAWVVREGLALTGLSVRDAAELFRTAPGTVSRWENNYSAPALVARQAVRDVLRTRVARIARELAPRRAAVPA